MFRDLPEFLRRLDQEGELLTVTAELSPEKEIAAAIREVEEKTTKALYLDRVKGYPSGMVGNLLGHRRRIALALGNPGDPVAEYGERRKLLIPPVRVKEGPVQEVSHTKTIDLPGLVPALTHHDGDAGPYLTSAIAIARDPETGIPSCGIHRVQLKGRDKFGILLNNPPIAEFFRKAEALSRPLPIAFVIGCDPLTLLSSVVRTPQEEKLAIGGGLASRPVEVVHCPEFDLEVPAHCEFVLLGEVLPGTRESEGPFGETSGYYMTFESPVGRISKVLHRKNAVYHSLLPFSREDSTLIEFLWEAEHLSHLRGKFPCLVRIHFPPRTLGLTVLASIKPAPHDQVRELIQTLWET
ncbi:MAG: UbiD family decarboxylase, partial [Candidatus Binatia bacterium]|nr:UbiD family decarboxylase [Candidatus Binatia bacterium]